MFPVNEFDIIQPNQKSSLQTAELSENRGQNSPVVLSSSQATGKVYVVVSKSLDNLRLPGKSGNILGGILSSTGSGASLGAAIGTLVPGVGNIIGAGIGTLAGGIEGFAKSIFGHSDHRPHIVSAIRDNIKQAFATQYPGHVIVNDAQGVFVNSVKFNPETMNAFIEEIRQKLYAGFLGMPGINSGYESAIDRVMTSWSIKDHKDASDYVLFSYMKDKPVENQGQAQIAKSPNKTKAVLAAAGAGLVYALTVL